MPPCIGDVEDVKSEMQRDRTCVAAAALGLTNEQQIALVQMNDTKKWDFNQIADHIEANL